MRHVSSLPIVGAFAVFVAMSTSLSCAQDGARHPRFHSLFTSRDTPPKTSWNDPNPIEVGVKFRASVAGAITAIRFYKAPQNTGTHIAHLWKATGRLLASAVFSKESARGWQQVTLPHPVPVTAGATYVVSYHTRGRYSASSNYFETAHTSGPLTAPASRSHDGNGVYAYGPGSFPTESFKATNYWVDLVFSDRGVGVTNTFEMPVEPSAYLASRRSACLVRLIALDR